MDDAYLYLFQEDSYLLVVNAANIDKDLEHLNRALSGFDCTITNISAEWASIAVQGPKSKEMLMTLSGGESPTKEPTKNSLGTVSLEGRQARIAKTGYTGEPLGYEVYVRSEDAVWLWNRLVELGARPAGLGARDTLRMEASFPLYGHEMGVAPDGSEIPIFAVPLAKFAVSFSAQKGDFIGRAALERQHQAFIRHMDRDFSDMSALPRRIAPIALLDRGVMRAGMEIYKGDKLVGWVTSGTMVPYFKTQGEGLSTVILEASGKRAIGLCYIDSDVLVDDTVEVDIRGKRLKAVIPARHMSVGAPPFARPLLYGEQEEVRTVAGGDRTGKALTLLHKAIENHVWRQEQCVNLIPSENTPSRAVRLLSGSDPACRYAEHKKILAFYEKEVFYYQGTKFIDQVERMLTEEMRAYFGCTEVETRTLSGQMSNMAVFSALTDWKNRFDRKKDAKRLGYVMNNHIIRGRSPVCPAHGRSARLYRRGPRHRKARCGKLPRLPTTPIRWTWRETKKQIDRYRPELIIFGKSMVLHKEPVAQIRQFVDEQKIPTTIINTIWPMCWPYRRPLPEPLPGGRGDRQWPTHKTFFGPLSAASSA